MKKVTNLLSIALLSSILACNGQLISQNVNIGNEVKPTVTPIPTSTIAPNVIKPSHIPSATSSPKVEAKKYTSVVFSLEVPDKKDKPFQETILEAPVFNDIKQELLYYNNFTQTSSKSYVAYRMVVPPKSSEKFELKLIYPDGTIDSDYEVEIPEEYKNIIQFKDGILYGLEKGNALIKISSKRNKQLFKFFYIGTYYTEITFPCPADPRCSPLRSSDIIEKDNFKGKILDHSNIGLEGVTVSARAIDPGVTWVAENKITNTNGEYEFLNAPVGARILITAKKEDWTKRQRIEVLKSSFSTPLTNVFDFEGNLALQDEPEITSLKVNTKSATETGSIEGKANLTNLDNGNLEVEMTFSEPVRTDDVQNYFRVRNIANNFLIDNNLSGVTWAWSNNDQTVKFMTNQAILANKTGEEAKYVVEFIKPFRDKTDKEAKTGKYIRFNPTSSGDFHVFSIKNDETAPKLLSITAIDGGSSNDVIELKFSEYMNIIDKKVSELELTDPLAPSNKTRSIRAYQTNNTGNNATILGYSTVDNSLNINDFRAVFNIAKMTKPVSFNQALLPLKINNLNAGNLIVGSNITTAKILGNTVTLEFPYTAFNKGDLIVFSVGRTILGKYEDKNNGVAGFSIDVDTPNITNATITDPAGNLISTANATASVTEVTVNDSQRYSTVQ